MIKTSSLNNDTYPEGFETQYRTLQALNLFPFPVSELAGEFVLY